MRVFLMLGNQLFPPDRFADYRDCRFFMADDLGLCTRWPFHKHRLIFYLAAKRKHAAAMRTAGYAVHYKALDGRSDDALFEDKLARFLAESGEPSQLVCFEVENKFMERRLLDFAGSRDLNLEFVRSPMFTCTRERFREYLDGQRKPFMKTFYEEQRRRLDIMLDDEGEPLGGRWSFDTENRRKLPKSETPPDLPDPRHDETVVEVAALVDRLFGEHPGNSADFWLPVDRATSLAWLDDFIERKLAKFGPYQDAMEPRSPFLYHSVLSPMLNVGLLLPDELIDRATAALQRRQAPIASVEGFVRQVIGWREFVRGIYQNYSERQDEANFWGHRRKLKDSWHRGETGMPPLDDAIRKAVRYGYCHHIERLMTLSNLMLLCEIDPREVHRWFMALFVDSSEWVMGPNVYGMGQFSDGGLFATKPYICGSNYVRKMSHYPKGDWQDAMDGLYWRFMDKHREFFAKNHRMNMLVRTLDRMDASRKHRIFEAAEAFIERNTTL